MRDGRAIVVGLLALGCQAGGSFLCSDDADCTLDNVRGMCQANRYCSFPASDCESDQRYGELAPAGVAGECVTPEAADGFETSVADVSGGDVSGSGGPGTTSSMTTGGGTTSTSATSTSTTAADASSATSDVTTGTPADPSLLLWLELDQLEGAVTPDSSDYGQHATCVQACPGIGRGHLGSGAFFEAEALTVANGLPFEASDGFTLAAWIRPADMLASPGTLTEKPLGGPAGVNSWSVRVGPSAAPGGATVLFEVGDATGAATGLLGPVDAQFGWVHVAATYGKRQGTQLLYIDGELASYAVGQSIAFDGSGVYVGAGVAGSGLTRFFSGAIDDFRIYDRPLSEDEIGDLPGF